MNSFQLTGLAPELFASMFALADQELERLHIKRVIATERPGYPCRVSLVDAQVGEELLLLSHEHQPACSPYQASGPIFVRKGAMQATLRRGEIPASVSGRLISARAYDAEHLIIDASVVDGEAVEAEIGRMLGNEQVAYLHLHNAKRGCFSCAVHRA